MTVGPLPFGFAKSTCSIHPVQVQIELATELLVG
jgi:hypothetical protein